MNLKSLAFVALVFVTGCATTGKYEKILQTYVGLSESELIQGMGVPAQSYPNNSGKVLVYEYNGGARALSNYNSYTNQVYTNAYSMWCKTSFFLDGNGTVVNWRWEGNSCRAN